MDIKLYKPTVLDIAKMQDVVLADVKNGNILDRSPNEMATTIRSYTVAKVGEEIVGFAALHIHTVTLAEIRSLIVKEGHRGKTIGKQLIKQLIEEARSLNLEQILVLTYQKALFESFDFIEIEKESIPETKIWADCIKCKHFPVCNEISLMLDLKK